MITVPALSQDWVYLGAKVFCQEDLPLQFEFLGSTYDYTIRKGETGKIIEFDGPYVKIGYFDILGRGKKDGYACQLRLNFLHTWGPAEGVRCPPVTERPKIPMITDFHPDKPGKKLGVKAIGFWAESSSPATCYYAQRGMWLPWPEDFIDPSWDSQERERVASYLDQAPDVEHWMGFSGCRFKNCDCRDNGASDKSDGTYLWPEGFSHYVRAHNVKPPDEFIQHVKARHPK